MAQLEYIEAIEKCIFGDGLESEMANRGHAGRVTIPEGEYFC